MSPRVYLIVPALAAFVIDVALTLWGQPREYWNGDYGVAQEMAPVGFALLAHHPLAFVLAAAGYAILFSLAIRFLPGWLALWLSLGYLVAHSSGANSWLLYVDVRLEALNNGVAAGLAALCYSAYFRRIWSDRLRLKADERSAKAPLPDAAER